MSAPSTLDNVPALLKAHGLDDVAAEWALMQEVLSLYANDEDASANGGEPYGSIPTEAGMKARQHRAAYQRATSTKSAEQQ